MGFPYVHASVRDDDLRSVEIHPRGIVDGSQTQEDTVSLLGSIHGTVIAHFDEDSGNRHGRSAENANRLRLPALPRRNSLRQGESHSCRITWDAEREFQIGGWEVASSSRDGA
jgi:hypothetical protein